MIPRLDSHGRISLQGIMQHGNAAAQPPLEHHPSSQFFIVHDQDSNDMFGSDPSEYILVDAASMETRHGNNTLSEQPAPVALVNIFEDEVVDNIPTEKEMPLLSKKMALHDAKLWKNPRNLLIHYEGKLKSFVYERDGKRERFTGVHTILKKTFFPYSTKELFRRNKGRTGASSTQSNVTKNMVTNEIEIGSSSQCADMDSCAHGSRVDEQMQMYIMVGRSVEMLTRECDKKRKVCDPCAVRVLREFERREWRLERSQFVIYHEGLRVATAVDVMVTDKNGDLYIISIKTSATHASPEYFEFSPPDSYLVGLSAPRYNIDRIPFSFYAIAMLQLALEYYIVNTRYAINIAKYAILVRIGVDKIWFYEMPQYYIDIMPQMHMAIMKKRVEAANKNTARKDAHF